MERPNATTGFYEEQPFLPSVARVAVVVGGLVALAVISYVIRTVKGFPANAITVVTAWLVVCLAYDVLLALATKTTEVREDGLVLRARPLPFLLNRTIPFPDIAEVVKQGNKAVQVRLTRGQSITVRTGRADELTVAIGARMK
jgi:hypothetical protein